MTKKTKKGLTKYAPHLIIIGVLILSIVFLIFYFKGEPEANENTNNAASIIYSNGKEVQ